MQKCPICGGAVGNGVCLSCGYEIPDEGTIAAPYNYDPDDYELQGSGRNNDDSDLGEMDVLELPSSESIGMRFDGYKDVKKAGSNEKTQENFSPLPTNYTHIKPPTEEPYEEPESAFSVFVNGFVYEVKRHWWKVLLIFFVPVSAIIIGGVYFFKGGGRRHRYQPVDIDKVDFKALGAGLLYFVIGFGLMLEGWDPIGLNRLIMSFF